MNKINKALSITLAAIVSMPTLAESINTDDFSFGGRVEARAALADSDFNDKSRVRINGQGKHEINEALTAVGKFEYELTQEDNSSDTTVKNNLRYAYVGVETAHGTLTYGTQDNAVTYLTNFTDVAEVYSGYTNEAFSASGDRSEDTVLYSVVKGDLTFNASANLQENEKGGGLMAAYKLLPSVEVSAGYAATEGLEANSSETNYDDTKSSDVYMIGARYTQDNILVSGLVQKGTLGDADFNAVDAFASYGFGENLVSVSYNYYSADEQDKLDVNFVAFEYGRYIGDVAAYAGYKVALNNDTSAGSGNNNNADEFIVGARYSF
ncbi:porin [Moritella sp. F3]|uniref:porin n=1 Tax=Moritella sp. F3 TaxID=2718882 RepID=UPI0018E111B3|nr:porin [Moritella sp. F3]GIC79335.1 outer membrane protein [Moritella sp. F1]GIC84054.1 outer membrane protein [Moritella sp. F3]